MGGYMIDKTTNRKLDENSVKRLLRLVELEKEAKKELKKCEKECGALNVRTVLLRRVWKAYAEVIKDYK